jgi:hypothetical protein
MVLTRAIKIIPETPLILTPGTNSSATFTTMQLITKEKAPKVMRRMGKVIILKTVPRTRLTKARMITKIRREVYPFSRIIHEIYHDWIKKERIPAVVKNWRRRSIE